jgi:hypothetical protein
VARPYPYVIFYRPDTTGIVITGSGMLRADRFSDVDFWTCAAVSVSGGSDDDREP